MTNKTAVKGIIAISLLALVLLAWIIYGVELSPDPDKWKFLPATNALFNAMAAAAIITGIFQIKRDNKRAHGISMGIAFLASCLFLAGYILHHALHGDSRFAGTGWIRPVYFFILITHILLSAVVLPLVLTTLYFAMVRHWSTHRMVARITWPVWLYVSFTGILVFLFLRMGGLQ